MVFSDHSIISKSDIEFEDWRASVVGELIWTLNLGYFEPVSFHISYAHGFMEKGIHELVFIMGNSF